MGASNFKNTVIGKYDSAHEAYHALVASMKRQHGDDGYNGTISTTSGFVDYSPIAPRYGTKAWDEWENDLLQNLEKFGKAACVQLTGKALQDMKDQNGIKAGERGYRAFVFFGWGAE